ncbi:MAG TPA: CopG family transcriptional regulator [Chloroflexota bacterium]|nr:CopG family transcriptional regulator [Chloroflexota bacterium]
MRMIRKQLYLGREHQRKLKCLAAHWGCTEAAVVREALERLPDLNDSIDSRLAEAGLLMPPPFDPDLPTGTEAQRLEQSEMEWLARQRDPLGLAEAVLADRR